MCRNSDLLGPVSDACAAEAGATVVVDGRLPACSLLPADRATGVRGGSPGLSSARSPWQTFTSSAPTLSEGPGAFIRSWCRRVAPASLHCGEAEPCNRARVSVEEDGNSPKWDAPQPLELPGAQKHPGISEELAWRTISRWSAEKLGRGGLGCSGPVSLPAPSLGTHDLGSSGWEVGLLGWELKKLCLPWWVTAVGVLPARFHN